MSTKPKSKTKSGEYHVNSSAATSNLGELGDRSGAYVLFDTPKMRGASSNIGFLSEKCNGTGDPLDA